MHALATNLHLENSFSSIKETDPETDAITNHEYSEFFSFTKETDLEILSQTTISVKHSFTATPFMLVKLR